MKPVFRYSAVIVLSLLAGWLGFLVGRPERKVIALNISSTQTPPRPRTSQPATPTSDHATKLTEEQLRRQVIARCDTRILWEWLGANSIYYKSKTLPRGNAMFILRQTNAVIDELIDRLGMGAWEEAMAFGDQSQQEKITELVLNGLSRRDVWQAFDLYQKSRAQFDEEWGVNTASEALASAGGISTDKLIGVLEQSTASKGKWTTFIEYPAGFDFKKLADYMENSASDSISVPGEILSTWASRNPLEAAEWLAAHPTPAKDDDPYRLNDPSAIKDSFANIIASTDASRDAALKKFAELPQPVLQQVWEGSAEPKIDFTMLAAADHMDQREPYLIESLLKSRRNWQVDPSWQTIPAEERLQILNAAEQQWAEKSPSPIEQRARQRWRKMVTETWSR